MNPPCPKKKLADMPDEDDLSFRFPRAPTRQERDAYRQAVFQRIDALAEYGLHQGLLQREAVRHACLDDITAWAGHRRFPRSDPRTPPTPPVRALLYHYEYGGWVSRSTTSEWAWYTWRAAPLSWRRPGQGWTSAPEWQALQDLESSLADAPDESLIDWAAGHRFPLVRAWGVLGTAAAGRLPDSECLADPSPMVCLLAGRAFLAANAWRPEVGRAVGFHLGADPIGRHAARLLGAARDAQFVAELVELAEASEDVEVRWAAVDGLGAPNAVPDLIRLRQDRSLRHSVDRQLHRMPSHALASYVDDWTEQVRRGDGHWVSLLGRCGPAADPAIDVLLERWDTAVVDEVFGLDNQGLAAAFALARISDRSRAALATRLEGIDLERAGAIARAFSSVGIAPPFVLDWLRTAADTQPEEWSEIREWGWTLEALATLGDPSNLACVARIYCDLVDDGLPPDNHHRTPVSFHSLGDTLTTRVPPRLEAETDRDLAWRWTRTLGAVGRHITKDGRAALERETLHMDSERARNARRVLDKLQQADSLFR